MTKGTKAVLGVIGLLLILGALSFLLPARTPSPQTATLGSTVYAPPAPSRTADCQVAGALPDQACTPGAVIADATASAICQPGYAKSVRNVPEAEKNAVYAEYGISSHASGEYEVDHLISLELGGSNDIANLWPEAANPTPGFHQKDSVENYLHDQVCSGKLSLAKAQQEIAENWLQVYQTINR